MKFEEIIDLFRTQVDDRLKPYLFSETEVLLYAIDSQDEFVRLTGGITDSSTPEITRIAVEVDVPLAEHSPYILRFRSAKLLTARRQLRIMREEDVPMVTIRTDYGINSTVYLDDEDTGPVTGMVLGVEENKVRWFRVPEEADTCALNVFRLPYPRCGSASEKPEIDEQHHQHLVMWMKHRAYSKEDAETYDKDLAEKNKLDFEAYCFRAKQEIERKRYRPGLVQYGGL